MEKEARAPLAAAEACRTSVSIGQLAENEAASRMAGFPGARGTLVVDLRISRNVIASYILEIIELTLKK